jgi:hypothetical protein
MPNRPGYIFAPTDPNALDLILPRSPSLLVGLTLGWLTLCKGKKRCGACRRAERNGAPREKGRPGKARSSKLCARGGDIIVIVNNSNASTGEAEVRDECSAPTAGQYKGNYFVDCSVDLGGVDARQSGHTRRSLKFLRSFNRRQN